MLDFGIFLILMAFIMLLIGLMIDVNASPSSGGGIVWAGCAVMLFIFAIGLLEQSRPGLVK
jgi:hypothetical protein